MTAFVRQILNYAYLSAFFCLFSISAHASWLSDSYATNGQRELERAQQLETLRLHDEEGAVRLLEFRKKVEDEAYQTTMNLCYGYRLAKGLGIPHELRDPNVIKASSVQAWSKIFYEGTAQPFSTIAGLKGDYLSEKNISLFAIDSWFRSLYTIYLLDSTGFLQASAHCLNTLDHDQIVNFASTILAFDLYATAGTELALGGGTEFIFSKILKAANAFVIKPIWHLSRLIGIKRAHVMVVGIIVFPIAADNFYLYMKNIENAKTSITALLTDSKFSEQSAQRQRFSRLYHAYEILKRVITLKSEGVDSMAEEQRFKAYVATQFSIDKRSSYLYDQQLLSQMPAAEINRPENQFQKTYLALLNLILPTLEI